MGVFFVFFLFFEKILIGNTKGFYLPIAYKKIVGFLPTVTRQENRLKKFEKKLEKKSLGLCRLENRNLIFFYVEKEHGLSIEELICPPLPQCSSLRNTVPQQKTLIIAAVHRGFSEGVFIYCIQAGILRKCSGEGKSTW